MPASVRRSREGSMRLRDAAIRAVVALAAIAVGACSSLPSFNIESKKVDYKNSGKLPPLEVPPDLSRPSGDDRFVVPDVNPRSTATYSDYNRERTGRRVAPGESAVLPKQENVHIERD